jgi:glycosyltransferase involved in cell wall biosynthesis
MKTKLTIQQRVIPFYRAPFFELMAKQPDFDIQIVAGKPQQKENIRPAETLKNIRFDHIQNVHLFSGKVYLCLQPGLLAAVRKQNPDVIIMEANARYLSSPSVIRWMKSQHKPVIGWGLGVPKNSGIISDLLTLRWKSFLRSFDKMIAYSQKGADEYLRLGFDAKDVYVAANAAVSAPAQEPPLRSVWQKDYQPIVLYVGRIQQRKKLDHLINACAELPDNLRPQLWIVGDGPNRAELEQHARKRMSETRFWGEKVGNDLVDIFRQADLFVLPGTGGLAVQQAMSHALPVIVAEGDGTQGELVSVETGWRVDPHDPSGLRKMLIEALSDPHRLRLKGLNAFDRIKNQVNIEMMVKVFSQAIRDALMERKK